ncbi:chemerin-like receptor 1 [Anguilla rostrata]|uniref:chemerin-like receptor 1 n=1 Tax=Anguilla rostrata TaxID=7938 RepID=UPI0030D5FDE0
MAQQFTTPYNYDYIVDITHTHGTINNITDTVPLDKQILSAFNIVIFLLGVCGNGVVIWISGFKMKRSVNTTWYLSLAISDFIFCASLPFTAVYLATSDWLFGLAMCKFTSFVMFLKMFSSIFLLVLISVDRCVSVVFPVWSQNHRTARAASALVLLAWAASAVLSVPSLIFRKLKWVIKTTCYNDYKEKEQAHLALAVRWFLCGFVVPFLVIAVCYVLIILKLRRNRMIKSSKPFKVMSALIVTFFICWLPYHVLILLEFEHKKYAPEVFDTAMPVCALVASANSFLNPLLYAFMGKDFKKVYRNCLLSKIDNALSDDAQTSSKRQSLTQESKVSTHV